MGNLINNTIMVYQDYELIATKRVGHSRKRGMLLLKQQYTALGGMNTVYLTTFFGIAGHAFGLATVSSAPALTQAQMASTAGMSTMARRGLMAGGPALVGLIMGVSAFGNATELRNLVFNAGTYSSEMKAVRNEHYY